MLRQAETKASSWGGRLTLRRVDEPFLQIPYEETSFDAVVSAFAIHHLDDDAKRRAVKEMVRVLRPGGRIVIADTMFRDAEHKLECLARHKDLEDEHQPLLDSFPAMLEAEGMETSVHQVSELFWVVVAGRPSSS
jgi:putative AdoMet-dependent methyltransferase